MLNRTITVQICGMSGEGTIAAGAILNSAAAEAGLNVLAFDSYPSEIRGFGKCVTHARFGEGQVLTQGDAVDILISLHGGYSSEQLEQLQPRGVVVYDNRPSQEVAEDESLLSKLEPGTHHYGVPMMDLSQEAMSSRRGRNLVALGALVELFGLPADAFAGVIERKFYKASDAVRAGNLKAFELGIDYVRENIEKVDEITFDRILGQDPVDGDAVELVSGHQAVARACVDQRVALYAGYPITPATPIMEYLAKELPKVGGAVVQMEDEIASIGCVVGAGYGGKRAVTATSGPGISLMSEVINLAVMAEVPSLVINAMRGGPSTGLPTKTEQSDLNICVYGGSGDSPRIVLAPANVEESYKHTELALWLAERYQTPVVLTYDFFIANRVESVAKLSADEGLGDGNIWGEPPPEGERFKRYAQTETGISPRSAPGMAGLSHPATGLEHSEYGLPVYDTKNHLAMTEKRWSKIEGALADTPAPVRFGAKGKVKVGVITWGSSVGAATEAVELAVAEEGIAAAGLSVGTIWPLHVEEISSFMDDANVILCPEGNRWGQFADLVSARTGRKVISMPFPTGMPLTTGPILERIKKEANTDG